MKSKEHVWIIGAGNMGKAYAQALNVLGKSFTVVTRGARNAETLRTSLKSNVFVGSLEDAKALLPSPTQVIIAVNTINVPSVLSSLLDSMRIPILVEKPGFISSKAVDRFINSSSDSNALVYIGYNRKSYKSVKYLKNILDRDPPSSIFFDFTEFSDIVATSNYPSSVKKRWIIENSSHIIDLFVHLAGAWPCEKLSAHFSSGCLDWHPSSAVFAGFGITTNNVRYSYSSDWSCPGRWSVECKTPSTTYLLKPLERLSYLKRGEKHYQSLELDYTDDIICKPGILQQSTSFLSGDIQNLNSLQEQKKLIQLCEQIGRYTPL